MILRRFLILFTLLTLTVGGCAKGGDQPTLPGSPLASPTERAADNSSSRDLWGYWQCAYDADSGEIVAVPARTALFHLNAVKPLNSTLGLGVQIDPTQSDPSQGLFVLTVSIAHPYPGDDNLTGFDVRGILITTGSDSLGGLNFPGENDPALLNADGYTRWWNPVEFPVPSLLGYTPGKYGKELPENPPPSCINPYKQFANALMGDNSIDYLALLPVTDPNGRGVFRSGKTNNRTYRIQFPVVSGVPQIIFNYAIDASWAQPTVNPPSVPTDFPMAANAPEAFIVRADVTENTLWAIEGTGQGGGELTLSIECRDWQGWMDTYDGQFGEMVLLSPFCEFNTGVVPNVSDNGEKATLTASVPGVAVEMGTIPVWVGVTAPGTSYLQGAKPAPDVPVAAFDLIMVNVTQADCNDNGNSDCDTSDPIGPNDSVTGILCLGTDDADWFSFWVPQDGAAAGTIHLETYGISQLYLKLHQDCPGTVIGYSNPGADQKIELDEQGPGEYFIEVSCVNDGDPSPRPYLLETTLHGLGEDCSQDTNNQAANATFIALDGDSSETVCLIGDSTDWYTFTVTSEATAYGDIHLDNKGFADNDLALFGDPVGNPLYVSDETGTVDEHLYMLLLEDGKYYLRMDAKGTSPSGDRPFTLTMDLIESVFECDSEDDNNTPEEADYIDVMGTANGTVCFPSDPDWFTFDAPPGGVFGMINLTGFGMYDNDIALYDDPVKTPIQQSANPGNGNEVLNIEELEEGTYYLRVSAASSAGGINQQYGLVMQLYALGPKPVDFYVHAHIVRSSNGTDPAIDLPTVQNHIDWADQFYDKWIDGAVILWETSYINNTNWLSLTTHEADQMFAQYGDDSGALHVFYVNTAPDMPGAAAYTYMECQFSHNSCENSMVVMTDYADDPTLAHEMGHAIGLLADTYLLDFYDCNDITWCPYGPTDIFCDDSDAVDGNLMYWPNGPFLDNYWISDTDKEMNTLPIDSQAENIVYYHTAWPNAFHKP
jgi:hypothetical protein